MHRDLDDRIRGCAAEWGKLTPQAVDTQRRWIDLTAPVTGDKLAVTRKVKATHVPGPDNVAL